MFYEKTNLFLALSHPLVTTASAQIQRQQPEKTIKLVVNDPYFYFCGSESCYDVLQLAPTANKTEIKSSYRKLAALYHPDKNGSEEAKARLQVIMKAYKVLMDDGKDSEGNWKLKEKLQTKRKAIYHKFIDKIQQDHIAYLPCMEEHN